ncbi:LA_2272 family surface repeat-containing protein [Aquimarina sp. 2201CG14-23]|uniref:LA_2272 family surface repeat-containing protein n=1 Tax=Aquimarina mycalae TaxID=3040073 RepID=UPI00247815C9|nr:hypothetical protein [Aquimarina sp. 2201CG14-23]MDH7445122.1 hypothetical protein [Aquimarina sp. 2201CG14-23]
MKNEIVMICMILISVSIFGQEKRKAYFPVWTYHSEHSDIYGLSLGVLPKDTFNDVSLTRSYGVRVEAPGFGLFYFMAPKSFIKGGAKEDNITEKVYGFNVSGGSLRNIGVDGCSVALVGQYLQKMNGIAIAAMGNSVEEQKGIMAAFMMNEMFKGVGVSMALGNHAHYYQGLQIGVSNGIEEKGTGLQIGVFNKSKNFRGIQIGLWNKNERRSLPFINWQFSKKKVKSKTS